MKFDDMRSVGHNIADSVACGCGFMIGTYFMDVFGEAVSSPEGSVTVDFLTGTTSGAQVSAGLAEGLRLYADALDDLCVKHCGDRAEFAKLTARYAVDRVHGPHVTVTVADRHGRCSEDRYQGYGGRRLSKRRVQG